MIIFVFPVSRETYSDIILVLLIIIILWIILLVWWINMFIMWITFSFDVDKYVFYSNISLNVDNSPYHLWISVCICG